MSLNLSFRHMKPRDEVRKRVEALHGKLERFLDPAAETEMTVSVEHGQAILEIVITNHGETFKVHEEDDDLRTAIDKLFHKAETHLRRSKERRKANRHDVEKVDGFAVE